MTELLDTLPEASLSELRDQFRRVDPDAWVAELAQRSSWREANEAFLRSERDRGQAEMTQLLAACGLPTPPTTVQAADVVETALRLNLTDSQDTATVERVSPTSIHLRICDCPNYRRLEANNWLGLTACSSWHRRRGWYMALGLFPDDSVIEERKWGSEACEAVIEFAVQQA